MRYSLDASTHRAALRSAAILLAAALWLGGLAGCATTPTGSKDWAAIVIDLKPSDTLPRSDLHQTLERPWIGFGLASDDPQAPPPVPTTLQMRLRTGAVSAEDPQGQALEMIEVRNVDIGRPRSADGSPAGPVIIALDPPAASFTFTGGAIDWPYGRAAGPVVGGMARVSLNRGFVEAARQADADVTAELLLRAALMGVTTANLKQYNQLELQPTLTQIIQLVQADIPPTTVERYYEAGYGFTADELLELKREEVSVEDAVAFIEGGFRFDAGQLIHLQNSGVGPSYALGLKQAQFADDVDTLVRLRTEGVEVPYAQRMRQLGVANHADELVLLHRNTISPESVETFQKAIYNFDVQELIALKDAGVSADSTLALREAGYDFSMDDLIKLAKWQVPTGFALSLMSPEFEPLSADEIVELRLRRVTPEMVRLLRVPRGEGTTRVDAGSSSEPGAPGMTGELWEPKVITPDLPPLEPLDPVEDDGAEADSP